ncbi:MAG: hypothetical protein DI528_00350 [Shinella sp.]|nr:MAG: hypothetical protein DI528_00350 [Shinella sp.]
MSGCHGRARISPIRSELIQIGRDILSRIIHGARTSIGLSLAITGIAFVIGVSLRLDAVSLGGLADQAISRLVDLFMPLPPLILALLAISIFGTSLLLFPACMCSA